MMDWQPGTQLCNGRYTIESTLGKGRFGITYLAKKQNGEPVAIKTLNDEALSRPDRDRLQEVFVEEARKLAACHHPHIVKIEKVFQEANKRWLQQERVWCLAMEYVEGMTLAQRAESHMPQEEVLTYMQQIGEALMAVHQRGLVHRDVRPANIILRRSRPEAVLIDFGLARESDEALTARRTEEMTNYSPWELGSLSVKPGAYTDVYSLGATLYFLLTGNQPPSVDVQSSGRLPLEFSADFSPSLRRAIEWAMQLKPDNRPQSVREWLEKGLKRKVSEPGRIEKPARRLSFEQQIALWMLVATMIMGVGTLVGGLAGWIPLFQPQADPTQPQPKP